MQHLELYVMQDCSTCRRAQQVAERLAEHFPTLAVRVIDLDATPDMIPAEVFAAPTFRFNGRIVSLGTPDWDTLTTYIRKQGVV